MPPNLAGNHIIFHPPRWEKEKKKQNLTLKKEVEKYPASYIVYGNLKLTQLFRSTFWQDTNLKITSALTQKSHFGEDVFFVYQCAPRQMPGAANYSRLQAKLHYQAIVKEKKLEVCPPLILPTPYRAPYQLGANTCLWRGQCPF